MQNTRWDECVNVLWKASSGRLQDVVFHASAVPVHGAATEAVPICPVPAVFEQPVTPGVTTRCEVVVDLAKLPEVRQIQIVSSARICEVSLQSPGSEASYMCTVRGVPTDGISNFHTLLLEVPHITGCRLLLKMLSIPEKSRWSLERLTLVTEVPLPKEAGQDVATSSAPRPSTSQMDGVRSMLDSLMRPAAGATPVLNLGAMMGSPVTSNPAAAGSSYSPGISGMKAANGPSDEAEQVQPKADPARSLMGAIAKGIVLQQQKARLQAQVPDQVGSAHSSYPAATGSAACDASTLQDSQALPSHIGAVIAANSASQPLIKAQTDAQWHAQRELLQQLLERDAERGRQLTEAATALEDLAMQHHATQGTLEQLQSQMQQMLQLQSATLQVLAAGGQENSPPSLGMEPIQYEESIVNRPTAKSAIPAVDSQLLLHQQNASNCTIAGNRDLEDYGQGYSAQPAVELLHDGDIVSSGQRKLQPPLAGNASIPPSQQEQQSESRDNSFGVESFGESHEFPENMLVADGEIVSDASFWEWARTDCGDPAAAADASSASFWEWART